MSRPAAYIMHSRGALSGCRKHWFYWRTRCSVIYDRGIIHRVRNSQQDPLMVIRRKKKEEKGTLDFMDKLFVWFAFARSRIHHCPICISCISIDIDLYETYLYKSSRWCSLFLSLSLSLSINCRWKCKRQIDSRRAEPYENRRFSRRGKQLRPDKIIEKYRVLFSFFPCFIVSESRSVCWMNLSNVENKNISLKSLKVLKFF